MELVAAGCQGRLVMVCPTGLHITEPWVVGRLAASSGEKRLKVDEVVTVAARAVLVC